MAFVRKRHSSTWKGKKHYSHQLIETYRQDGKVKQRVLANLGPWGTTVEAFYGFEKYLGRLQRKLSELEEHFAKAAEYVRLTESRRRENRGDWWGDPYRNKPKECPIEHRYRIRPEGTNEPDPGRQDWMRSHNKTYITLSKELPTKRRQVEEIKRNIEALRREMNRQAA